MTTDFSFSKELNTSWQYFGIINLPQAEITTLNTLIVFKYWYKEEFYMFIWTL